MRGIYAPLILLTFPLAQAWAVRPDASGSVFLSGGQTFFEGDAGSFGGLAGLSGGLAWNFSQRNGLALDYKGNYQGFKQVNELAGGGTLFQQSIDQRATFKYLRRFEGGWNFKPRLSWTNELYRETKDEDWGKGLYDFNRFGAGLALDKKTRLGSGPFVVSVSYDFFVNLFKNFRSLTSEFGQGLVSSDPGDRLLDMTSHQVLANARWDLPKDWTFQSQVVLLASRFRDQKVVDDNGEYGVLRRDFMSGVGFGASRRLGDYELGRVRLRWIPFLNYDFRFYDSIQNLFDATPGRTQFVPNYYDFIESEANTGFSTLWLPLDLEAALTYRFSLRNYRERLTQDSSGAYLSDKVHQTYHGIGINLRYPLSFMEGMDVRAAYSLLKTSSNMKYEAVYRYNYTTFNYFLGLGWSFG